MSGWTSDGPQHPDALAKTESRPLLLLLCVFSGCLGVSWGLGFRASERGEFGFLVFRGFQINEGSGLRGLGWFRNFNADLRGIMYGVLYRLKRVLYGLFR